MQSSIGAIRNEIFLGKHFQGVRNGMKQAEDGKAQNVGPIGANPVLHDGALFAFHPGENRGEKPYEEAQDK